jgi:hypothetical protein
VVGPRVTRVTSLPATRRGQDVTRVTGYRSASALVVAQVVAIVSLPGRVAGYRRPRSEDLNKDGRRGQHVQAGIGS